MLMWWKKTTVYFNDLVQRKDSKILQHCETLNDQFMVLRNLEVSLLGLFNRKQFTDIYQYQ